MFSHVYYTVIASVHFYIKVRKFENEKKSVSLQYNTVERQVDGTIVPPTDGLMFILIDW